jgi:dihydroorotase
MSTEYLIRGGEVFDGSGSEAIHADVLLQGGIISDIAANLPTEGRTVVDATGLVVCPGLIDLHTHVYSGMGIYPVDPEQAGLRAGVTTLLDTGTAGALTYPAFHRFVIPQAKEDIYVLLHIGFYGCLLGHPGLKPYVGDLNDPRYADVPMAVQCIKRYSDRIIGTKVRLTAGLANNQIETERAGLHGALEAAKQTGRFFMVHHVASQIPVAELLDQMRKGDIFTHLYHPREHSPFEGKDRHPCDAVLRARERGVVMDVGHGVGSFLWDVAEPACQQHGFWPDTISTDLHQFNIYGPVYDMATTMSKLLHLGMALPKVIQATTSAPAKAMRLGDRLGLLRKGRQADVTLLRIETGKFDLQDVRQEIRVANQRLVAVGVFKRGEYQTCQSAEATRVYVPPVSLAMPSPKK